jgi:hypothetical protein
MMDSTNGEARAGEAERPQEFGAASPGRGGRMSRQRKTAAALIERDLLTEKIAILEPIALWPGAGAGHEPRQVAGNRQVLRALPRSAGCGAWRAPASTPTWLPCPPHRLAAGDRSAR